MQQYVGKYYIDFPSNNQLTERWVKDSNECTYLSNDEKMANIYAIVILFTVLQFQEDANEVISDRIRKGNICCESGKRAKG